MRYLVVGGAGYVGCHTVRLLRDLGHEVIVFDNLSTGHDFLVGDAALVEGDLLDVDALKSLFEDCGSFDAVLHFGALSLVAESVRDPSRYHRNNVEGTQNLLDAMAATGHKRIVFSSTAAVYGNPEYTPIPETHPTRPVNPYGETKLAVDWMLKEQAQLSGVSSVSLRYFNAAGAHVSGEIGELHNPETHLIPNVLRAAYLLKPMQVFGDDYLTPDGTCVRDYVHVDDLAEAHVKALSYLDSNQGAHVFNLGNGNGFSVREVIDAVSRRVDRVIPVHVQPRRSGDPAVLVADASKARELLGWNPSRTSLDEIVQSAEYFFQRQLLQEPK